MKKFIRNIRKIKLRGIFELLWMISVLVLFLPIFLILIGLSGLIFLEELSRFIWAIITDFEDIS